MWEELELANPYTVILTPPSRDHGRDIIATRKDRSGSIRILEQIKAYKPGHVVNVRDVREMLGMLTDDRAASKAFITTTSTFSGPARKHYKDYMPTRLELRDQSDVQALAEHFLKGKN